MSASHSVPRLPPDVAAKRSDVGWNTFSEAAQVVLSKWDLSRVALDEEWGGRDSRAKYNHMIDDLMRNLDEQWREGADVHEDTLDDYLISCMESYFNVDFDVGGDDVVTEVSLIIQDLYRRCAAGELGKAREIMSKLDQMPSMRARAAAPAPGAEDDSDGDDGSMEDDGEDGGEQGSAGASGAGGGGGAKAAGGRHAARVVDADGWEVVPSKGRRAGGGGAGGAASAPGAGASGAAAASAGAQALDGESMDLD